MGPCEENSCCWKDSGESPNAAGSDAAGKRASATGSRPLADPSTFDHGTPWKFYNHLIAGIPDGIAVTDYCIGQTWCYVDSDCGMGISHVFTGGAAPRFRDDPRDFGLAELAQLSKSWNFAEASLGVAAINAWYSQKDKVLAMGGQFDEERGGDEDRGNAFHALEERYAGKKVTVVGHFPNVGRMSQICDLTVLERNCTSSLDTPDPACEYVIPSQDFVLMTGTTIINKTAPRLLTLAKDAISVMVGPSTISSDFLYKWGLDIMAGSVVVDPENAKFAIKGGSKDVFRAGIKKYYLERPGCWDGYGETGVMIPGGQR